MSLASMFQAGKRQKDVYSIFTDLFAFLNSSAWKRLKFEFTGSFWKPSYCYSAGNTGKVVMKLLEQIFYLNIFSH